MMIEIDILPASSEKKGGDSVLIRIGQFDYTNRPNDQKVILIDGGYQENSDRIKEYLCNYYQTTTIDHAIITHPDQDHLSGFKKLVDDDEIVVKNTYLHDPWNHKTHLFTRTQDGRRTKNSLGKALDESLSLLSDTLDKVTRKNTEPLAPKKLHGLNIYIIGPTPLFYRDTLYKFPGMEGYTQTGPSDIYEENLTIYQGNISHFLDDPKTSPKNDTSVITLLHDDTGSPIALFTGDAGVDAITRALDTAEENGLNYKGVELFQIPHHGSIKNISEDLISRISPKYAYVSAPPNKDEHPSPLLINFLIQRGIPTYHIKNTGGIVFYHNTSNSRPGWESMVAAAPLRDRVRKLKKTSRWF
jgi:beta-lactamase superfamily II metal-dependent hydrolase